MSDNLALGFNGWADACKAAAFTYVKPYGIYHNGETYWHKGLPRRPGSVVRFFLDTSGPCPSLVILNLQGEYLFNAYPISWVEGDHPVLQQAKAEWAALTRKEQETAMRKERKHDPS